MTEARESRAAVIAQAALILVSALLLGAHFMRRGESGAVVACISSVGLLFIRRRWVPTVLSLGLIAGALLWIRTTIDLVAVRMTLGAPWLRPTLILGTVAVATGLTALVFRSRSMRSRFSLGAETARASVGAFLLTASILATVQVVVERPMLLADRFIPGSGWVVTLLLSTYAAWLAEKLFDAASQPLWRRRIWGLFSIVFFGQLALGLLGLDLMLMTGTLHLPVPAVILAGPIYRGGGFFMVVLFAVTLLFVGPAWCSYLCYFGAMDSALAHRRRQPRSLPRWTRKARVWILVLVLATAALLKVAGASGLTAAASGLTFGIVGLVTIVLLSRRYGTMVHCTVYCPLGLVADVLGKVSPFRVTLGRACTECGLCTKACRFDALRKDDIARRRPGLSCTLCGDCLGACKDAQIQYRFATLDPHRARALFMMLVAAAHAVFLGVARI